MPVKIDPTDIVGNHYGELTVLEVTGKKFPSWMYRCQCSCGKETVVARTSLLSGDTKSCGHLKYTTFDPESIIGQQFGKWTIEKFIGRAGTHHHWRYKVRCECGNVSEADLDSLKAGKTISCGHCYYPDIRQEDDHLRYICSDGDSFITDIEDFELLSKYRWYIKGGYPESCSHERLSRILLDAKENEYIDHINNDTRDNRRCNLRKATWAQNNQNKLLQKNNTSGYKGVCYHKTAHKYGAGLWKDGAFHYGGLHKTAEEAALAYDELARKYHGEYARLNFPRAGERGCRGAV